MRSRRPLLAALMVIVALVLTGCIKMDTNLKVNSDGTVDGTMIVAVSKEMVELSGQTEEQIRADIVEGMESEDVPDSVKVQQYSDKDFIGAKITLDDATLEEVNELGGSAATGLSDTTGTSSGDDGFRLERQGDNWLFTGTMDLSGDFGDLGGESGGTTIPGLGDFGDLFGSFEVKVSITFPGKVLEHDDDAKVSGNTATWSPEAGERVEMRALAANGGGGSAPNTTRDGARTTTAGDSEDTGDSEDSGDSEGVGASSDDEGGDGGGSSTGLIIGVVAAAAVAAVVVALVVRSKKGKGGGPQPPSMTGAPGSYGGPAAPPPGFPPGGSSNFPPPPPPPGQ